MILNGPKLLLFPTKAAQTGSTSVRHASWLVAAALTAAVWPALAVVVGHIGSARLGQEETSIAILRAIVGFMAAVGGAVVVAPALTLLIVWITDAAKERTTTATAGPVAMHILWPAWAAGLVLLIPPLFGLGPEIGEIAWAVLATIAAVRIIRSHAAKALGIRRRWTKRFQTHMTAAFFILFSLVVITPPMAVRSMLGADTPTIPSIPERAELPRPPPANW